MPPLTFSERLTTRMRLWWKRPSDPRALSHWLHDLHAFRSRDDPDEAWRCCDAWPRALVHKWNGREFAARHGAPLPELHWHGGRLARVPLERLPDEVVVKRVRGTMRDGVLVMVNGRELLKDELVPREELRRRLAPLRRRPTPLIAEAFVGSEDGLGSLPLELKCHSFGGVIAAVEAVQRRPGERASRRYYTPDWEPFADSMNTMIPDAPAREAPGCLEHMLGHATRLGEALGCYMRIDFFATGSESVFNEFASVPANGLFFTPYCDELFGALWAEHLLDAI